MHLAGFDFDLTSFYKAIGRLILNKVHIG